MTIHHQAMVREAVDVPAPCERVQNNGSVGACGNLKNGAASIVAIGAPTRGCRAVKITGSVHDHAARGPRATVPGKRPQDGFGVNPLGNFELGATERLASARSLSGDLEYRAATCGHPPRAVWATELRGAIEVACPAKDQTGTRIGAIQASREPVQDLLRVCSCRDLKYSATLCAPIDAAKCGPGGGPIEIASLAENDTAIRMGSVSTAFESIQNPFRDSRS